MRFRLIASYICVGNRILICKDNYSGAELPTINASLLNFTDQGRLTRLVAVNNLCMKVLDRELHDRLS